MLRMLTPKAIIDQKIELSTAFLVKTKRAAMTAAETMKATAAYFGKRSKAAGCRECRFAAKLARPLCQSTVTITDSTKRKRPTGVKEASVRPRSSIRAT